MVHLVVILIWRFWLQLPYLMYTNTTHNPMAHKAMYTQYFPVHQTKMSANVHYALIYQIILFAKYTAYTVDIQMFVSSLIAI